MIFELADLQRQIVEELKGTEAILEQPLQIMIELGLDIETVLTQMAGRRDGKVNDRNDWPCVGSAGLVAFCVPHLWVAPMP
jgi:hypothetical protein